MKRMVRLITQAECFASSLAVAAYVYLQLKARPGVVPEGKEILLTRGDRTLWAQA